MDSCISLEIICVMGVQGFSNYIITQVVLHYLLHVDKEGLLGATRIFVKGCMPIVVQCLFDQRRQLLCNLLLQGEIYFLGDNTTFLVQKILGQRFLYLTCGLP